MAAKELQHCKIKRNNNNEHRTKNVLVMKFEIIGLGFLWGFTWP